MSRSRGVRGGVWLGMLFTILSATPLAAEDDARAFAYVGSNSIITAEIAGPSSFILNYINLSDYVIVVQPNEFIYRGASERFHIGQVFEQEKKDSRGELQKYAASILLRSRSLTGLTILGDFQEQDAIEELSLRVGSRRYYLQPMGKIDFEILAAKIGELDLDNPNPREALANANIQDIGSVKSTDGTSEWDRDWKGLIRPDGVNLPKIIVKPEVAPTPEAVKAGTSGRVRLSAVITRNGGIQDLKVEKGLGRGLDDRAMEAVRNSWIFLPATRNGEVVEGRLDFFVDFPPPVKKP